VTSLLACQTKPVPLRKWRRLNNRRYWVGRLLVRRDQLCFRTTDDTDVWKKKTKKSIHDCCKSFLCPHVVHAINLWWISLGMLPAHIDIIDLLYVGYNIGYASALLPHLSVVIYFGLHQNYNLHSFLLWYYTTICPYNIYIWSPVLHRFPYFLVIQNTLKPLKLPTYFLYFYNFFSLKNDLLRVTHNHLLSYGVENHPERS
jgi:hypothetical protein